MPKRLSSEELAVIGNNKPPNFYYFLFWLEISDFKTEKKPLIFQSKIKNERNKKQIDFWFLDLRIELKMKRPDNGRLNARFCLKQKGHQEVVCVDVWAAAEE